MFRFKRRADTVAFTIAWWTLFVAAATTLLYYLARNVQLVASRDLFMVQTDRTPEEINYAIPFPDIGVCTKGLTAQPVEGSVHVSNQGVALQYTAFQKDFSNTHLDVCPNIFDTLHLFYYPVGNTVDIREKQYIFQYEFRTISDNARVDRPDLNIDMFLIPANDSSTIRQTGKLQFPRQMDTMTTMFTTSRNTYNEITLQPIQTKILRPGFMGLFGQFQKKEVVSFTWTMITLQDNSTGSTITLKPPITSTERRQVLVTSIQSAFAATGGAFTLVSILFMVVMGRPRYNPFGLFQSSFQRIRTHKKLKDDYAVFMSERGKAATPTIWDLIAQRRARHGQDFEPEKGLEQQQQENQRRQKRRDIKGVSSASSLGSEAPFLATRHGGDDPFERGYEDREMDRTTELLSPESPGLYGHARPPLHSPRNTNDSAMSLDKETVRGSFMSQTPQDFADMETMLMLQRERIAQLESQQERTEQKLEDLVGVLREYYVDMVMFEPVEGDSIKASIQQSFKRGAGTIKRTLGIGRQGQPLQHPHQSWTRRPYHQRQASPAETGEIDEARIGLTAAAPFGQATTGNPPGPSSQGLYSQSSQGPNAVSSWRASPPIPRHQQPTLTSHQPHPPFSAGQHQPHYHHHHPSSITQPVAVERRPPAIPVRPQPYEQYPSSHGSASSSHNPFIAQQQQQQEQDHPLQDIRPNTFP